MPINAVSFYYLWYGKKVERHYICSDKTLGKFWKSMYMRTSGAIELIFWTFVHNKSAIYFDV